MTLESQEGFVETIYPYLWLADPVQQKVPSVHIPDTIIFKNNNPVAWYFTLNGRIKYKTQQNLNPQSILATFLKKHDPSHDACALFIERTNIENQTKLIYHYMNTLQFITFINDIYWIKQGVLQNFIPSKGDRYNIYRCNWSPHMCLFEKLENKWLMNAKVDLYQKTITYEDTNAAVVTSSLLGQALTNKIETLVYDIVQHLKNVSIDKIDICRMQLILLINPMEQLYMLGCTNIRLMNRRHEFTDKQHVKPIFDLDMVSLPSNIDRTLLRAIAPKDLNKDFTCAYCEQQFNAKNLHEVTFQNIIRAFGTKELQQYSTLPNVLENQKTQSQIKLEHLIAIKKQKQPQLVELQENYGIPLLIRKIMPSLRTNKYLSLCTNPGFLLLTVSLCSNCFMTVYDKALNTYTLEALCRKTMNDPTKMLGTQKLKPERINELYTYTSNKILKSASDLDLKHLSKKSFVRNSQDNNLKIRRLANLAGPSMSPLDRNILKSDRHQTDTNHTKWLSSHRNIDVPLIKYFNPSKIYKQRPPVKTTHSTNQTTKEIVTQSYR